MTTIISLSQYLNSSTSSSSNNDALLTALQQSGSESKSTTSKATTTTTTSASGDQVTLSAKAQALLDQQTALQNAKKNYGFTLTDKQKEQLAAVIAKYKDLPQNQTNFDNMQKELKKLHLDTATLAAKEKAKGFNIKSLFQSILKGTDTSQTVSANTKNAEAKSAQYAKQIIADWKALNPTTTPTTTTA